MDSLTANRIHVKKWLTPGQSQDLRSAIYTQFPQMRENVQIVSTSGRVQVMGIRGFQIDPAVADGVTVLIQDFGVTPETEESAALLTVATTAATMQSYKRTIRQRHYRSKGGWR